MVRANILLLCIRLVGANYFIPTTHFYSLLEENGAGETVA